MTSLPTPRAFLTSLLNTLTILPLQPTQTTINELYSAPSNGLKSLPPSHRALLTTLHVLFPPPMLLQALNLLDRGLVTRLISPNHQTEKESRNDTREGEQENEVQPPQAHVHLPRSSSPPLPASSKEKQNQNTNISTKFLVRSSQPTRGRYASGTGTGMTYTVYLSAWNCSCAAFTFAAFPSFASSDFAPSHSPWILDSDSDGDEDYGMRDRDGGDEKKGDKEREWEFGGLGLDGLQDRGGVPVCKHLLACLLGERLRDFLGGYVKEREVGREEMAGYGAEG